MGKLVQPMKDLAGSYYSTSWPGYKFKEKLGYTSGRHTGVDYNGSGGGNSDLGYGAYAIGAGKVVKKVSDRNSPGGFGNVLIYELTDKTIIARMKQDKVIPSNASKVYVRYLHLSKWLVNVGNTVRTGQRIAEVGNTGTVWAHLHADLWHNGNGLGAHLDYHKDTQLASYLDIYKTVERYKEDKVTTAEANQLKAQIAAANKQITTLNQQVASLKTALENEKAKPPKEVVKEVEKIVKEIEEVEVVKEVEKPYSWSSVINWIIEQFKKLRSK